MLQDITAIVVWFINNLWQFSGLFMYSIVGMFVLLIICLWNVGKQAC